MDNSDAQQLRENHTNTLSEEHIRSAIETVLARREQSYEDFMSSFMVLTQDDVREYEARRTAESQNVVAQQAFDSSREAATSVPSLSTVLQGNSKQSEELEIEELGDDIPVSASQTGDSMESGSGYSHKRKYVQVDNFVDEPDSESEFLDTQDEEVEFDDTSSGYVASFDAGKEKEREAAKSGGPVALTPDMMREIFGDDSPETKEESEDKTEDISSLLPCPFPGEADDDLQASSPSCRGNRHHVTQLSLSSSTNSTLLPSATSSSVCLEEDKVTATEVQPFSIDPDFDYDNVTLTPKWEQGQWPPVIT